MPSWANSEQISRNNIFGKINGVIWGVNPAGISGETSALITENCYARISIKISAGFSRLNFFQGFLDPSWNSWTHSFRNVQSKP